MLFFKNSPSIFLLSTPVRPSWRRSTHGRTLVSGTESIKKGYLRPRMPREGPVRQYVMERTRRPWKKGVSNLIKENSPGPLYSGIQMWRHILVHRLKAPNVNIVVRRRVIFTPFIWLTECILIPRFLSAPSSLNMMIRDHERHYPCRVRETGYFFSRKIDSNTSYIKLGQTELLP